MTHQSTPTSIAATQISFDLAKLEGVLRFIKSTHEIRTRKGLRHTDSLNETEIQSVTAALTRIQTTREQFRQLVRDLPEQLQQQVPGVVQACGAGPTISS